MLGRSSDPIENVPQFEDFQCPVNQVTHTCQVLRCCPKDFELPVQDDSEVRLHDLSVGLLQRSQSGVRRKVGNVPTISVPGLDQELTLSRWTRKTGRGTKRLPGFRVAMTADSNTVHSVER